MWSKTLRKNINKLLEIASSPLEDKIEKILFFDQFEKDSINKLINELEAILMQKNGFYVFENALMFYPSTIQKEYGIEAINNNIIMLYHFDKNTCLFFAQDIFGNQFCIKENKIFLFDVETSEFEFLAETFEEWSTLILQDYNYCTGYPIAHQWQKNNGILDINERLVPKIPFVLGGEYKIENITKIGLIDSLKFRSNLASQILNLPDGEQIKLQIK